MELVIDTKCAQLCDVSVSVTSQWLTAVWRVCECDITMIHSCVTCAASVTSQWLTPVWRVCDVDIPLILCDTDVTAWHVQSAQLYQCIVSSDESFVTVWHWRIILLINLSVNIVYMTSSHRFTELWTCAVIECNKLIFLLLLLLLIYVTLIAWAVVASSVLVVIMHMLISTILSVCQHWITLSF